LNDDAAENFFKIMNAFHDFYDGNENDIFAFVKLSTNPAHAHRFYADIFTYNIKAVKDLLIGAKLHKGYSIKNWGGEFSFRKSGNPRSENISQRIKYQKDSAVPPLLIFLME